MNLYHYIASDLVVYPKIIDFHLREELPYMATENFLAAVEQKGLDRKILQETLKRHTQEVTKKWKLEGIKEDLLSRLAGDKTFGLSKFELEELINPMTFIGRAQSQVREFLQNEVQPLLKRYEQIHGYRLNIEI